MVAANRRRIALVSLLILGLGTASPAPSPAQTNWKRIIVKCDPRDLDEVRKVLGGAIVDYNHGNYLLNVSSSIDLNRVKGINGKSRILASEDERAWVSRSGRRANNENSPAPRNQGKFTNYFGAPAARIYTEQTAVKQISLKDALENATGAGTRVAVIDTGIDFRHKAFPRGTLLLGKNYVGRSNLPAETDDPILSQNGSEDILLDQNGSEDILLDQNGSEDILLDQNGSEDILLDGYLRRLKKLLPKAPLFGHGTMVAGLVHLVAPRAQIIPLKAFDASGSSTEWIIVQAIYDAVDMGADVINMSFSTTRRSEIIEDAVQYANSKGVILVGSAGNDDSEVVTYPASFEEVVAVTSVTSTDAKASFANYGKYVDLSAPGVELITTFPGNLWARVSGTSESAPMAAGVFSLALDSGVRPNKARTVVEAAVDDVKDTGKYKDKLGSGRIDAAKAVKNQNQNN